MKTRLVYNSEKFIAFISLLSLLNLIFPQTEKVQAKEIPAAIWEQNYSLDKIKSLPGLPQVKNRQARHTITLTVTAYSSSVDECDSDPFTTASGEKVRDGIIAYNFLPFGAKVRFPEKFGDKVFTVTDRMAAYKGKYIADIWMPSKNEAKQWGVKVLKMEIL
ncbi:MAG: 3D domain-containing protein [Patescibacteria group bacterium]